MLFLSQLINERLVLLETHIPESRDDNEQHTQRFQTLSRPGAYPMTNAAVGLQARHPTKHPYLAMTGLFIGTFTGMFSETALNIAIPRFMEDFGIGADLAQWMVVGYMLVIGIVLPFAGLLMKWVPARLLAVCAVAAFLAGSLLSALAPSFGLVLAGRMIQGIGTGLVLPLTFAVALEVFPPNRIGTAMGVAALIIMFAPVVGPTYSGIILGVSSWRVVFFTFAALLSIALVLSAAFLVSPFDLTRPAVDAGSCVYSVVGFAGIVFGSCLSSSEGWISAPVLLTLAVSILALIAYARRQLASAHPMLNLGAFAVPGFGRGTALVTVNFAITLASMYILPQYLQSGRGLPVSLAGILMLPGGIVNALVSFLSGRLYDRYGAKNLVRLGFAFTLLGSASFLLLSRTSPLPFIVFCHLVLMIGIPLSMSPAQTSALHSLPRHLGGDGSAILNTLQQVAGAVATAVSTSLLGFGQRLSASSDRTHAFVSGTRCVFVFALALALCGFVLSLRKQPAAEAPRSAEAA